MDFRYTSKVELEELADGLDDGYERKRSQG